MGSPLHHSGSFIAKHRVSGCGPQARWSCCTGFRACGLRSCGSRFVVLRHVESHFLEQESNPHPLISIGIPNAGPQASFCAQSFKFNQLPFVKYLYFHSRRWAEKDLAAVYIKVCSAYVFLLNFTGCDLTFRSLIHFEFIFM